MKKIIFILISLILISCWNNNIIKNESEDESLIKEKLENNKVTLWNYEKEIFEISVEESKKTDVVCLGDYIYKDRYKIKNNIDFSEYEYIHRKWLLYRKEYSIFDIPEFNIDKKRKIFNFWCYWDFLIKWKYIHKNINKNKIIKKYNEYQKKYIKENLEKNNKFKKYSYDELKDVFAISWNLCQWDILYKWERFKDKKNYSDYYFWMFAPTKEEQKKYDELTKIKIYWDENPLDFLAKNNMYCLWDFFDWNDWIYNNILKQKLFDKYYNDNKEAKKIKYILLKDLDKEKITLYDLKYINIFYKKYPNFLSEIRFINSLDYIYKKLWINEKKYFLNLVNKILETNENSYTFSLILNFYIDNWLLKENKEILLEKLKKWFWFNDSNYFIDELEIVKDYINNPDNYKNKINKFEKIK